MLKKTFVETAGLVPTGESKERFEQAWITYVQGSDRSLTEEDKYLAYWFWLTARIETLKLSIQIGREMKLSLIKKLTPEETSSNGTDV